jgi:1,2-diacylglycerol 3-alpha-glucosyltransferase
MKILICTPEYPPKASGIGIVVKSVADEFKEQGHECIICSPTGPDLQLGNQTYIEKFGGLGLVYFWECVRKFFNKNGNNFDSIWLNHPLFIMKNPFSKSLITMHTTYIGFSSGSGLSGHSGWIRTYYYIMNAIEKYSLTACIKQDAKFTSISKIVAKELQSYGIRSNIAVIPNGTNTKQFHIQTNKNELRKEFQIPENKIVFLWAGRLIEEKRPDILIKLFSIFRQISDNFFLVIVGDGKLSKQLKKSAEEYQLKNILFLGSKDYSMMPRIYACCDYYIISSIYEGQPLTLLEALSSGLPSIVSDIPSLRIVEEANCGIVIDFSDIEKASKTIFEYASQDNSKYALNARKYAEENLDWGIITEKYFEELKKGEKNDYI